MVLTCTTTYYKLILHIRARSYLVLVQNVHGHLCPCIEQFLQIEYIHCLHSRYEYRWADGVQIKKPLEVSAPKYVEYLMDWIEGQLDDEAIFPQKIGMPQIRSLMS